MNHFVRAAGLALLSMLTSSALAQQPPYMPASWFAPSAFPVRPPLEGPDRRPREEQPPQELGNHSLMPARTRRDGLEPRVGVTVEYNDNVYFKPSDQKSAWVGVISPGANYRKEGPRSYLEADYSLEGSLYAGSSHPTNAINAQTGFLFWNFAPTERSRVIVTDNLLTSPDSQGQLFVPGATGSLDTTTQNYFDAQGLYNVTHTLDARVRVGNVLQRFENPLAIDNRQTDLEGGLLLMTSSRNRAGVKYRYRDVRFSGTPDASTSTIALEDEARLTKRVTVRAVAGVATLTGVAPHKRPVLHAAVIADTRAALLGLSFEQDVQAAGGLGSLLFGRTLTATAQWRIAPRWYLNAGLSYANFSSLGTDGLDVKIREPRLTLTYTVRPGLVLAGRFAYVRQDPNQGPSTAGTRTGLTIATSF